MEVAGRAPAAPGPQPPFLANRTAVSRQTGLYMTLL